MEPVRPLGGAGRLRPRWVSLFHLVQNHAFIDGNKRVGAAAAIVFLDLNGIEITAGDDDLVDLVLGVAAGQVSKSEVADFLRRCAPDAQVPVEPSDGCAVAGARGLPLRLPVLACVNLRQMRPRESER